ncbi:hypothetical protein FZEAL_9459 [Fusarium zealandicum]|uniref:Uncharacterized protein n=1 Tax=Fusarium zealandicum TaxID=1053134 RepID=A0A8H4UB41_9HYPO|nr:hypothetical protein FZEAL_9459 [Fusarium zealandicum]
MLILSPSLLPLMSPLSLPSFRLSPRASHAMASSQTLTHLGDRAARCWNRFFRTIMTCQARRAGTLGRKERASGRPMLATAVMIAEALRDSPGEVEADSYATDAVFHSDTGACGYKATGDVSATAQGIQVISSEDLVWYLWPFEHLAWQLSVQRGI